MVANINNSGKQYLTNSLVEWMSETQDSLRSQSSIGNTCVDLLLRVTFVVAVAITQIIDCFTLAFTGIFHLFTDLCNADSRRYAALCFIGCVSKVLAFPKMQAVAFRRIFLPFMDYWAPKSPHSLRDWHNHKLRQQFIPDYLRKLPDDEKSHSCVLGRRIGGVLDRVEKCSGSIGAFLALVALATPWLFLRCCIPILEITASVVFIAIAAIRCLVCGANRAALSNSFYNCIYEIDLVCSQITLMLMAIPIAFRLLVESTGSYTETELNKITEGNLTNKMEDFYKLARDDRDIAGNNFL